MIIIFIKQYILKFVFQIFRLFKKKLNSLMVHLFSINIFKIYRFICSIILLLTDTVIYTPKSLSVISFNKIIKFIFSANLPHGLTVCTT